MSLIIATGSNLGDSRATLNGARELLCQRYSLVSASRIYTSRAVDYENQPDFFNQVLEFELPSAEPLDVMIELLNIEKTFGRNRDIPKGPRILDIDIIFWGLSCVNLPALIIPHPRWSERAFVVRPLKELPFFQTIEKCFTIPKTFTVEASPIE